MIDAEPRRAAEPDPPRHGGGQGKVAAVDLLPMEMLPGGNFRFWQRDLTDSALPAELLEFLGGKADAVVSDAAPNTTGSSFTDQARSADLVRAVFGLARETLRDGGTFLAKIFGGAEADAVFRELRPSFTELRRLRPEATRKESFELYFLGKGSTLLARRPPAAIERSVPEHPTIWSFTMPMACMNA